MVKESNLRTSVRPLLWFTIALLIAGCTPPYQGNLGKFVNYASSSSSEPNKRPEAAFDGNAESEWASCANEEPWIEARFSQPLGLKVIEITWTKGWPQKYTVLVQRENGKWGKLTTAPVTKAKRDRIRLNVHLIGTALRIRIDEPVPKRGVSISEIELFGVATGLPHRENLRNWVAPKESTQPTQTPLPPKTEEEKKVEPSPLKNPVKTDKPTAPSKKELPAWTPPPLPKEITDDSITPYLLEVAAHDPPTSEGLTDDEFLDLVERRTFGYFWWETNPTNGLVRDRGRNFTSSAEVSHSSIAAVGFGLAAYVIGAERGWVTRSAALERVRRTLKTFDEEQVRNVRGMCPHFVNMYTGEDSPGTEISTIDTALLLYGAIVAMEYFQDAEVSRRTQRIFERCDWKWAKNGHEHFVTHGLNNQGEFFGVHWSSFNEGIMVYPLALGNSVHPLPRSSWKAIDRHKETYEGYEFVVEYGFQSIFRYQYPALFYDYRGLVDENGMDYFLNVQLAILAMRQYCIEMARDFPMSYGPDAWGLGAADGPGNRYYIYGFPPGEPYSPTDGSIIPYAVAGSIPFLPQHSIRALRNMYDQHRKAWGKYGFADCINPSQNFIAQDVLGLDAGTILLGIENYRSEMIWKLAMRNRWMQHGSRQMGWKKIDSPHHRGGPIDLAASGKWRILASEKNLSGVNVDDSDWSEILVPDRWENSMPELKNFDGQAWYRTHFTLDRKRLRQWLMSGRAILLTIGGIDDADMAFVNGKPVGHTKRGPGVFRETRNYRVPSNVLKPGENVIAIRVTDYGGTGGIWLPPVLIGPGDPTLSGRVGGPTDRR